MQAIRQHLFVRTELQTGKAHTVEDAGRGIGITDHQLTAQGMNIAGKVRVNRLPAAAVVAVAIGAVVAQTPWPQIHPRLQANKLAVYGRAIMPRRIALPGDTIVEKTGVDPLLPLALRYIVSWAIQHRGLRHGKIDSLLGKRHRKCHPGDRRQPGAGFPCREQLGIGGGINQPRIQILRGKTGRSGRACVMANFLKGQRF